jgi:hypothetical protein
MRSVSYDFRAGLVAAEGTYFYQNKEVPSSLGSLTVAHPGLLKAARVRTLGCRPGLRGLQGLAGGVWVVVIGRQVRKCTVVDFLS